jgi:hypothetical protein
MAHGTRVSGGERIVRTRDLLKSNSRTSLFDMDKVVGVLFSGSIEERRVFLDSLRYLHLGFHHCCESPLATKAVIPYWGPSWGLKESLLTYDEMDAAETLFTGAILDNVRFEPGGVFVHCLLKHSVDTSQYVLDDLTRHDVWTRVRQILAGTPLEPPSLYPSLNNTIVYSFVPIVLLCLSMARHTSNLGGVISIEEEYTLQYHRVAKVRSKK